jgi:hypothetical protein
MTTKMPNHPAATARRRRPRPVVVVDIIVAILISLVGLIFMLASHYPVLFIASRVAV